VLVTGGSRSPQSVPVVPEIVTLQGCSVACTLVVVTKLEDTTFWVLGEARTLSFVV
jgi:hypothetical protein